MVGAQDHVDVERDAGGCTGGGLDREAFGLREGHFEFELIGFVFVETN